MQKPIVIGAGIGATILLSSIGLYFGSKNTNQEFDSLSQIVGSKVANKFVNKIGITKLNDLREVNIAKIKDVLKDFSIFEQTKLERFINCNEVFVLSNNYHRFILGQQQRFAVF
jgi:hypothetical protein